MISLCGYDFHTYGEIKKEKPKNRISVGTELEESQAILLKEIAIEYETSTSEIIRELVKEFLLKYKRQEISGHEEN